ncbi:restriction endonuclease subunit S [Marinospirillum sp. MEB164]|uniref:Restriction endonuclease subunit S n=1 Tax=Marinospirillum alkalitolerans TaxID=3123374 RepID=A0ABW8PUT5_9GAMM
MSNQVAEVSAKYLSEAAKNAVPVGYKQTEVGMIPEDWGVCELEEVITLQRGFDLPNRLRQPGTIPIVSSSGVTGFHNKAMIKAPGIVTGRYGTIGQIFYLRESFWPLNTTLYVSEFKKVSPEYAYHLLKTVDFESHSGKSGVPGVNRNDVYQERICVPSAKEQTAIANALSDVDALISELEKLIAKKQAIKTATMQQLLTGRTRLPQFALREDGTPKGTKPSELGEIPEDWVVKKIGDFTDCTAGGTPSTSISGYWGGTHPWMSSGELHLKRVFDVAERITDSGLANSSTKYVPVDSVLIGLAGQGKTRGTVAIARISLCTNQSIASVFPSESHSTDYLFYNLDNRYEELRGLSTGDGGRGGLNLTIIRNLSLPYPDIEEQTAIATILSDMDAEIQALEQRLGKTRQIKQGMMQELLTGKTRLVQPLNKESQHG